MSVQSVQDTSSFNAIEYTRSALIEELALLERHMRDGTAYICGCAFDSHLPMIAGLSSEGIKFAEDEKERRWYEALRDWSHERIKDLEAEDGYKAELLMKEARERRLELRYKAWEGEKLSGNPDSIYPQIEEQMGCIFEEEKEKPKGYFDPRSFRTLCPECPEARCSLCPEELACATRVIIGCKKGEYDAAKDECRIGTETHVVAHGESK